MKSFNSIDVRFNNKTGIQLSARLELPESPDGFAIFSPCFTCTKETLATYRISRLLAQKNTAVLRIDFTGLGESEGDFGDSNFSSQIEDILAANRFLAENYQAASLLIGHSMGGTASYAAASAMSAVKAVISIASPSTPAHVTHHFGAALEQIKSGQASEFYVAGKPYPIKPQFIQDLEQYQMPDNLRDLDKATLIFHSEQDKLVDIKHAEQLFSQLPQPKSFVSLDTADHILSDRKDCEYVADVIASWVKRYI